MLPFYKSAVSMTDGTDFDIVDQHKYLESITLSVHYKSVYWVGRLVNELKHLGRLCGPDAAIASPKIDGNTVTVTLGSWDSLFNFDQVLMSAGYGYTTYREHQSSESITKNEPEDKSYMKPLLLFGASVLAVVILLICLS